MANLWCAGGSHSKDILAIWNRVHGSMLHLYDDDPRKGMLPDLSALNEPCYVGINDPIKRREIVENCALYGAAPLVDPSVVWGKDAHLGPGVVVGPHSTLLTGVWIGAHTHVNYGVHMTRCDIGAFVTIAPGVTICGDVVVGADTFIGAGATICNNVTIGRGCIIGAGSLVRHDVPDGATVWGSPATVVERA